MSTITYRKDIDGLRAVAVLLVIFAHAKIKWLAGGFIGVDVFFVISGFLITSIIKRDLEQGTFSFVNFYMRRIRRILPALVFLLVGTTILSPILLPADLILYAKSAVAGITAWSNIFFGGISGGYWGKNVSVMPLAHLWSLAVEEQFYFIWPTVLFCLFVFIPPKKFSRTLLGIFLLLFLVSAFQAHSPSGYYKLTARAFELMFGALLALEKEKIIAITSRVPAIIISSLGIGLIVFSALLLRKGLNFPGLNAVWPCLGAVLLLVPPRETNWVIRLLESRPMIYIGKISYSLYLWHWPVFALILYYGLSLDEWRWPAIFFSFFMAIVSYHKIEQPFRKSTLSFGELCKRFLIIPAAACVSFMLFAQVSDGMMWRYSEHSKTVLKMIEAKTNLLFENCHFSEAEDSTHLPQLDNRMCFWGIEGQKRPELDDIDVILVGDSHALAMRGLVEVLSADAAVQGVMITKPSTPYLPGVDFIHRKKIHTVRREQNEAVAKFISESSAKYVVLTARYSVYLYGNNEYSVQRSIALPSQKGKVLDIKEQQELFATYFEKTIVSLLEQKKIPVVIKDVPEMGIDLSKLAAVDAIRGTHLAAVPAEAVFRRQQFIDSVIDEIAIKYPSVRVINPKDLICREGNCFATLDDMPLYADDDHLNYYGSRYLGEKYLSKNPNPFSIN